MATEDVTQKEYAGCKELLDMEQHQVPAQSWTGHRIAKQKKTAEFVDTGDLKKYYLGRSKLYVTVRNAFS